MTFSLKARLFLAHVLVLAGALALMGALAAREQRRWVVDRTRESLEHAARNAAAHLPDSADWDDVADRLGDQLGYRVTLIDSAGTVLGDSDVARDELARVESHATRPEVIAALERGSGSATRQSRTVDRELMYLAVRVPRAHPVAVLRPSETH